MPVSQLHNAYRFPPVHLADNSGLLAIGGELSPEWLLSAYRHGIFPWFNDGEPIMWWSPNPRMVLFPKELNVSKSMRNILNRREMMVRFDTRFKDVMTACGEVPRHGQDGTWINPQMLDAYCALHEMGIAHSVEVYYNDQLVGGLYGIALGSCFFGESMFATKSNASKVGFIALVNWLQQHDFSLVDCQVTTSHLQSLGAREIDRQQFIEHLDKLTAQTGHPGKWNYSGFPLYQSR